jgi:hypothetical protein
MSLDREVGEIKTELKQVRADVVDIKSDIKLLLSFRGKSLGFVSAVSFIVSTVAALVVEWVRR